MKTDVDKILARLDQLLPGPPPAVDWSASIAFRWRKGVGRSYPSLQPVRHVHRMRLSDLQGIEAQIGTWALHRLDAYRDQGPFPAADRAFERALALPFHTRLTDDDLDRVADVLTNL